MFEAEKEFSSNSELGKYRVGEIDALCECWSSQPFPRVPLLNGFCLLIKRDVVETIGYFDEESFPKGYGEESDYLFRANDAGYGAVVATNTFVFHHKTKSYGNRRRKKFSKAGTKAFRRKFPRARIVHAQKLMREHPVLRQMRHEAESWLEAKTAAQDVQTPHSPDRCRS